MTFRKYSNKSQSTIRMKPVDVKSSTYIDFNKGNNEEDPKFEVENHLKYQNTKAFLQKVTLEIGLNKFLWLKKLKILCHGHMLLVILMVKILLESFTQKNCKK